MRPRSDVLRCCLRAVSPVRQNVYSAFETTSNPLDPSRLSYLSPGASPDQKILLLARDVLELGAQWSIRVKDIPSFERYMTQLLTYYHDYSSVLPESQRMYSLIGLNLLRLLAQNRISDFHTALETIELSLLHENIYIR
ncbi:MAG: LOW QUALITY PROTEIN: hypothetical protein BJ554DRAFT_4305, partial [Olpidium bornovanus]